MPHDVAVDLLLDTVNRIPHGLAAVRFHLPIHPVDASVNHENES